MSHPNLLAVTDFFVGSDAQPYLVTDYLEGRSLQDLIDSEGRLPEQRALSIFRQICSGLKHAHSHGIIHRDLKPANVMLVKQDDDEDVVKIIDFGIAKVVTEDSKRTVLTETGDIFGSPAYMSPEQCRGKPLDVRSDIYSMGCILYSMLAGKPPFTGSDDVEFMYKHVHEAPPAVSGSFSAYVAAAIGKMLQKEPESRFACVADVMQALYGVTTTPPRASSAQNVLSATAVAAAKDAAAAGGSSTDSSPHAPNTTFTMYAVAAVVVLLAIIPIATMMRHSAQPDASTTAATTATAPSPTSSSSPAPAQPAFEPPPPAPVSAPAATVPPTPAPAPTAAPAPAATAYAPVRRPVQQWTKDQLFDAYMQQGKDALKVNDTSTARRAFNASHDIAFSFGSQDPRFISSMEWQARTAMKMGNYTQAIQGLEYILAIRRTSSNKDATAETEALLHTAQDELRKLDGR
jgi:serine/threonine-protein kinase